MKTFSEGLKRLLRRPSLQAPALGERELIVMKILWQNESLSAKQVLDQLPESNLSLSTMQSTLERLSRKTLLRREKSGRHYLYSAALQRSELIALLLGNIAEQISDGQMAPMISGFMEFVGRENSEAHTDNLQDLIEQLPASARNNE